MKQINANCRKATTPPTLLVDGPPAVLYTAVLDSPDRCHWVLPDTATGGGTVMYGKGKQGRLIVPPSPGSWEADLAPVFMEPPVLDYGHGGSASKLTTNGRDFLLNGARWLWKGSSDFRLYQWWLENRNIQPVLDQRKDAGGNLLRVFGMYNGGIGRFIPAEYQHYFDGWHDFAAQCAESGFQIEVTAFADAQTFMPSTADQQTHWRMLGSVLESLPNVVVELVNEWKKNGVDPAHFSPLYNLLCSRGSGLGDEAGFQPGWQYQTWHGRRDWPKVLFSAEDGWYVGEGVAANGQVFSPTMPVVHDEPIGFDEVEQPGRRSSDPYVARVVGQSSAAYCAGATFHSSAGIQSEMWGPTTDLCARTFYAAMGA